MTHSNAQVDSRAMLIKDVIVKAFCKKLAYPYKVCSPLCDNEQPVNSLAILHFMKGQPHRKKIVTPFTQGGSKENRHSICINKKSTSDH